MIQSLNRFSHHIDVLYPSDRLLKSVEQYESGNYEIQSYKDRNLQLEQNVPNGFTGYEGFQRDETPKMKNHVTPEFLCMEKLVNSFPNAEAVEEYCSTVASWAVDTLTRNYIPHAIGWSEFLNGRYADWFREYQVTKTYYHDGDPIYLVLQSKGSDLAFLGAGTKEDLFVTQSITIERPPHPTLRFSLSVTLAAALEQYENGQYEAQSYKTHFSCLEDKYNYGYNDSWILEDSMLVTESFLEQEKQILVFGKERTSGMFHCRLRDCFFTDYRDEDCPTVEEWAAAVQGECDEKYKDLKLIITNDPWPIYLVFKNGEDNFVPLGAGSLNHCFSFKPKEGESEK